VLLMGSSQAQEAKNIVVLGPSVGCPPPPEGEHAEARQAREVAEEKVHDLSSSLAEGS
jgi:hypothetical protein